MASKKIHTHYDILKVAMDAPPEVIRAAFKVLAQKYHPDKWSGSDDATKIMQLINESYAVLMDPARRAEYDSWIFEQELDGAQTREQEVEDEPPTQAGDNFSMGVQDSDKREAPLTKDASFKFGIHFWGSILASALLVRAVGALGAIVAFLLFNFLSDRIGKIGAAVTALFASVSVSLFASYLFTTSELFQDSSGLTGNIASSSLAPPTQVTPVGASPPGDRIQSALPVDQQHSYDALEEKKHFDAISAAHPDAASISESPGYANWLQSESGKKWESVVQRGTAPQVIAMLHAYKEDAQRIAKEQLKAREKINADERKYNEDIVRREAELNRQQNVEMAAAVERTFERFPYLRQPEYGHVVEKIVEQRDLLIAKGVHPSIALTRAVNDYAYAYDPRSQRLPMVELQTK